MKKLVVLATALLLSLPATAQNKTFDLDALKIPHKKFVLDNGLTLLVHEDHSAPVVGVNSGTTSARATRSRGKTGFAHLFEHFFFNGSEHYPHGFREAMDDLGANNRNGTTNNDRTNFFEDVPDVRARPHAVPRSRPHGLPRQADHRGDARARARRGAERKAAGREPALRPRARSHGRHLSVLASLQLVDHRQHGRPRRRHARRREGVVSRPITVRTIASSRWPATSRRSAPSSW